MPVHFSRQALAAYLANVFRQDVEVLAVRPLKDEACIEDPKGFGYGGPLVVDCMVGPTARSLVVARTRPTQGFGHDYPADRAWQALYAHSAYNGFPRHARSIDVGFARASGELVSVADTSEFFQLVEKVEGTLYWLDLERLLEAPLRELDVRRAEALARLLAEAHAIKRDEPTLYHRRIRELVGHGECLMGILDSYPHPYPMLPPSVCEEIERMAVGWRWRLRGRSHRLSCTHGDFHPWNLFFRDEVDLTVLDRSRGEWGEPADDVAALAVNYLLYGLRRQSVRGTAAPFDDLLRIFIETYLRASGDREVLEVLPPFFTFRALVIAHPLWYPTLSEGVRRTLIHFARRMLMDSAFDPGDVRDVLQAAS